MAYKIRKVKYCYITVPNRVGQGTNILGAIRDAGVDLVAFSGFPVKGRRAQVDLVTDDMAGLRRVAKKNAWRLSKVKGGFLVQGTDEVGAVHKVLTRLAKEKINVVAVDAVAAGKRRYGMIMWVRPKDYNRTARIINAK
ncbi:MAG: hypothetical protein ACE5GZ_11540 [Gammaproteobacteria bacterium]